MRKGNRSYIELVDGAVLNYDENRNTESTPFLLTQGLQFVRNDSVYEFFVRRELVAHLENNPEEDNLKNKKITSNRDKLCDRWEYQFISTDDECIESFISSGIADIGRDFIEYRPIPPVHISDQIFGVNNLKATEDSVFVYNGLEKEAYQYKFVKVLLMKRNNTPVIWATHPKGKIDPMYHLANELYEKGVNTRHQIDKPDSISVVDIMLPSDATPQQVAAFTDELQKAYKAKKVHKYIIQKYKIFHIEILIDQNNKQTLKNWM